MAYISRNMEGAIVDASRFYSVIIITGPRQSGKSTLVKHIFANYHYLSLEDPDIRSLAQRDPRSLLGIAEKMIIDEAQRMPELFSYIQTIVDGNPTRKFVLTGSANFLMLKNVSQSLAGRAAVFELLPFAMSELKEELLSENIDKQLINGFYPALREKKMSPRLYYKNYVTTYLERDVRTLSEIKNLDVFQRFIRLCAGRIGSVFVASELSNELGVSVGTINSWLSVLQASYIVYMLKPFYTNANKRLVKSRKIYFHDTGLAAYLLGITSAKQLNTDRMRGHLFENMIVSEAIKKFYNKGEDANLYFYRDSNGVEIDLMVQRGSKYDCFEIKSAATYHPDFEKSIISVTHALPSIINSGAVIYSGETTVLEKDIKLLNLSNFAESF